MNDWMDSGGNEEVEIKDLNDCDNEAIVKYNFDRHRQEIHFKLFISIIYHQ